MTKIKTYVLMISNTFPKSHPRAGELTEFVENIFRGEKLHTIRANFDLWKKRVDEVNKGVAEISVRTWSDKPYQSKQVEEFRLTQDSGCGIELISMHKPNEHQIVYSIENKNLALLDDIARNDGLALDDFRCWFFPQWKGEPQFFEGAVIHFTKFRYDSKRFL